MENPNDKLLVALTDIQEDDAEIKKKKVGALGKRPPKKANDENRRELQRQKTISKNKEK